MATSATVTFVENGREIVKIYHHSDGYIEGVGYNLASYLSRKRVGNGLNIHTDQNFANGVGCLAAQYIRDFKFNPGSLYITSLNTSDKYHDYNYRIEINPDRYATESCNEITRVIIRKHDDPVPIFVGTLAELLNFKEKED